MGLIGQKYNFGMFSKSQIKLIRSLSQKKYRHKHKLFIVEGKKAVNELLESNLKLHFLFTTENVFNVEEDKLYVVSEAELKKVSQLSTPQKALAVFHIPEVRPLKEEGLLLALDGVQDPGNLGTIIRMCDWFGLDQLICSEGTVDCFNPKVVQATMGSIGRVQVNYLNLPPFLNRIKMKLPVYGAFLQGSDVYQAALPSEGLLVMGNEANGISPEVEAEILKKLSIPRFGKSKETESLNVATATAIFLSEFSRRIY